MRASVLRYESPDFIEVDVIHQRCLAAFWDSPRGTMWIMRLAKLVAEAEA